MALIDCLECGHEVSDSSKTCPNCGANWFRYKGLTVTQKFLFGFLGLLIVLCMIGLYAFLFSKGLFLDGIGMISLIGIFAMGMGLIGYSIKANTRE